MSMEVKIHAAQTSILRELLFVKEAGYAELQKPTGLTSDHFNFHMSRLIELDMVQKLSRGRYSLTSKGKEYSNKLDTDDKTIERQPKVAVLLAIERMRDGTRQLLFQQRLKNPYYEYWGFPSGKMRWGETILQTAARELKEETGLIAGGLHIVGVYHEHAFLETETVAIEDKVFFMVRCTELSGTLLERYEGGINAWMSIEETEKLEKRYTSFSTEINLLLGKTPDRFVEEVHRYTKDQF